MFLRHLLIGFGDGAWGPADTFAVSFLPPNPKNAPMPLLSFFSILASSSVPAVKLLEDWFWLVPELLVFLDFFELTLTLTR